MNIPSIESILSKALQVIKRFPLEVLIAVIASIVAILMINCSYEEHQQIDLLGRMLLSLIIGFLLLFSFSLFVERNKLSITISMVGRLLGIFALYLIFLSFPQFENYITVIRVMLLEISMVSLVSILPFLRRGEVYSFWQFNKMLFLRLLTTVFYSFVLYMGLSLALLAVDKLFVLDIDGDYYLYLMVIIVGIFGVMHFLSGVSRKFEFLKKEESYPHSLRIFVQYILIPIVLTYLAILYVYEVKILMQWELPKGWVAYLVSSFSVVGLLAFLLIYPIHKQNPFLNRYFQWFLWTLIPLIVLLNVAIYVRVNEYGITENRYLLIVMSLWLSFVSVYLLVTGRREIRIIPLSLVLFSLLISFGSWGVFEVSKDSQLHRLQNILQSNEMLEAGKYKPSDKPLNFEDNKQICSIVDYLCDQHDYNSMQALFVQNLDSIQVENERWSASRNIIRLMGIKYISKYSSESEEEKFFRISFDNMDNYCHSISGYQNYFSIRMFGFKNFEKSEAKREIECDSLAVSYRFDLESSVLKIEVEETEIEIDLLAYIEIFGSNQLNNDGQYFLDKEKSEISKSVDGLELKLVVNELSGRKYIEHEKEHVDIIDFTGIIFFSYKKK